MRQWLLVRPMEGQTRWLAGARISSACTKTVIHDFVAQGIVTSTLGIARYALSPRRIGSSSSEGMPPCS